ncbi:hypothetical protein [Actinospica sp.]|uniref:hypothetical protein n=1 Tax=Actinospica sp. TaxID=1872142 RepID=UPI002CFB07E0|nr:hypothetical protein [Actinospica sp.]HWG24617.1 hypothetical protein [Actinospica sp.]
MYFLGVESALSGTAATGLILGAGALGSGLLVLGLTVLAVRRGNREEELRRRGEAARAPVRSRTKRSAARTTLVEPGTHDAYPQQPYSAAEPRSHRPYSRTYKLPRQDSPGATNGHLEPRQESAAGEE